MRIAGIKNRLKEAVYAQWVDWCIENNIDFSKQRPIINDFGTKFEVQLPELEEEE